MLAMPVILAMCCAASFLACTAVVLSSMKKDKRRSAVRASTVVKYMHGSAPMSRWSKVELVVAPLEEGGKPVSFDVRTS